MFQKIRMLSHAEYLSVKLMRNYGSANTIYALSSGYGKCGVAVVRVSGPASGSALKTLTRLDGCAPARVARLTKIYDPASGDALDRGLVLWFPAPRSFTGEDCCEFQVHGSAAVVAAVLRSLGAVRGLRPAQPGEFTRRAFLSGKMDLTEVEGLADLLQAETELQRKQAYLQAEGALSKLYNEWRRALVKALASVEAVIDFEETESLDDHLFKDIIAHVLNVQRDIVQHLGNGQRGEVLRSGVKTVIVGEPNAGKSSLLNNLCQKPEAITSPVEGTTRDVLQVAMDIGGYPLILMDTAGLRKETDDAIEREGMRRALSSLHSAHLVLIIIDVSKYLKHHERSEDSFLVFFKQYLKSMQMNHATLSGKHYLIVLNKSDLVSNGELAVLKNIIENNKNTVLVSCKTDAGIKHLTQEMTRHLENICGNPTSEHPSMSRERHRDCLGRCVAHLERFLERCGERHADLVLTAEQLRGAARQLGKLTGAVTTEELLDVVFKNFCIGK